MLDEQIRTAFDGIHADEGLKVRTLDTVLSTVQRRKMRNSRLMRLAPAFACLMLAVFGSLRLYFKPTAVITLDINPSVELAVNRFDRVVTASGINSDGRELLKAVRLEHLPFAEAVEAIIRSDRMAALISGNEFLEIGVVGDGGKQESRILFGLEKFSEGMDNISCYASSSQELAKARELGMSCGKYRIYAVLLEKGTDLTPEQAQGMSMRNLRELAGEGCNSVSESRAPGGSGNGNGGMRRRRGGPGTVSP